MAERPVFSYTRSGYPLVIERLIKFKWNPGFAATQKKKNVAALHEAASRDGLSPILEVSSKSDEPVGKRLSAFSLKVETQNVGKIPLECAFQGSKVFQHGGPYVELFHATPREAKRDPRLRSSGRLVGFNFEGREFPIDPDTVFYDWLYLSALLPHREFLQRLSHYAGFTDIEYNPAKSINCQARSCALMFALIARNNLVAAMKTPESFFESARDARRQTDAQVSQPPLRPQD